MWRLVAWGCPLEGRQPPECVRDFHSGERLAEDAWAVGWETWVG